MSEHPVYGIGTAARYPRREFRAPDDPNERTVARMNAASNAEMNGWAVHAGANLQAKRWIARQLSWERVLDALRGDRHLGAERRAA